MRKYERKNDLAFHRSIKMNQSVNIIYRVWEATPSFDHLPPFYIAPCKIWRPPASCLSVRADYPAPDRPCLIFSRVPSIPVELLKFSPRPPVPAGPPRGSPWTAHLWSEACGRSNMSRSIQVALVALQHLCLEDKKLTSLSLSSDAIVSMNYWFYVKSFARVVMLLDI
jgi:hypothetical protein